MQVRRHARDERRKVREPRPDRRVSLLQRGAERFYVAAYAAGGIAMNEALLRVTAVLALSACACGAAIAAGTGAAPTAYGKVHWQPAQASDMQLFEPYIGTFQSRSFHDDEQNKDFHYLVEYRWFDAGHSIVKFSVRTVVPVDGKDVVNGEGYYGYDAFAGRLYAYAFFTAGMSGFGGVSEFDPKTHRRVTRAHSLGADGHATEVRDEFELVDAQTWKNTTYVSREGGPWQQVYSDTFTRL
jgi:hypothetical protein